MSTANISKKKISYKYDINGFLKQENPQDFNYSLEYKASQSTNGHMAWLRLGWLLACLPYGRLRHFNVVDIGAGNLSFTREAEKLFKRCVPYDLCGRSITDQELYSTPWDLIIMSDVLEHYHNIDDLWTLNFKYGLISFPETPKDYSLEQWRHFKPNEHIYCLTLEKVIAWVKKNNYKVNTCGHPEDAMRVRWDKKKVNISTILIQREVKNV